jgi:hypothetical protein
MAKYTIELALLKRSAANVARSVPKLSMKGLELSRSNSVDTSILKGGEKARRQLALIERCRLTAYL